MKSHGLRLTAVALLLLALAASAAQAAPVARSQPVSRAEAGDFFVTLVLDWITSLLAPEPAAPSPNTGTSMPKEGSQLDPNGGH